MILLNIKILIKIKINNKIKLHNQFKNPNKIKMINTIMVMKILMNIINISIIKRKMKQNQKKYKELYMKNFRRIKKRSEINIFV